MNSNKAPPDYILECIIFYQKKPERKQNMAKNRSIYGKHDAKSKRAIVYIDGFNLYFGLKAKNWRRYYWLDIWLLGKNLLRGCHLEAVKYFTAHVKGNPAKTERQQAFLHALRCHQPQLDIIRGQFLHKEWKCHCGRISKIPEEKKTDVNIASYMLADAFRDRFDVAILISGDSDLVPPIEIIHRELPNKEVIVAFPPKRVSKELQQKADHSFFINQDIIRMSVLPNPIIKQNGQKLYKPSNWQ